MAAFREALAVLSERIAADTEAVAEWSARIAALTLAIAVFATLITADAEAVIDCPERIAAPRLAVAVLPTLRAADIVAVSVFGVYPDAAGTSNSAHVTLTLTGTRKTSSATRGDDPLYLFFTSAPDLRYPGQRLQTLFADTAYPLAMSMTISGSCASVESGTNIMTKAESANTSGMPVSSGP